MTGGPEEPGRRFTVTDRRLFEEFLVLNTGYIAVLLTKLEGGADLDPGEAMVAADAVRRSILETAIATIEEELGGRFDPPGIRRKVYVRSSAIKRNDRGACEECGIAPGTAIEWTHETVGRKDLLEGVAERLDRGMYASEDCPGCRSRTMVTYSAYEIEDY